MLFRTVEPKLRGFFFRWMGISLVLHVLAAVFSVGYHSADEQFQILEFLSYKLGTVPVHHLPVEFGEQMRPWLQPFIYWCITKVSIYVLGIESPFRWAFFFRLFTGFIGWLSTVALAYASVRWFESLRIRKFVICALALIWFFPVLHVRPSSESLAGSTFILGLMIVLGSYRCLYKQTTGKAWQGDQELKWKVFGGFLLGLSFEFRFQMGLMISGVILWMWFVGRHRLRALLPMLLGLGFSFILGRLVDCWGYGRLTLSPYHYVVYNLVRGEVSRYGNAPWWDIFRMSFTESWPILGTLVLMLSIVAWIRNPKHVLTWCHVPFFLVHEIISHKELRFFFPIASAAPVLIGLSVNNLGVKFYLFFRKQAIRWLYGFLVVNNGIALTILLFLPCARTVQFYEGVEKILVKERPKLKTFELMTLDRDPYEVLGNPIFFYRPKELKVTRLKTYSEIKNKIQKTPQTIWFFLNQPDFPKEAAPIQPFCKLEYQTIPSVVLKLIDPKWVQRTNVWQLYRCTNQTRVSSNTKSSKSVCFVLGRIAPAAHS